MVLQETYELEDLYKYVTSFSNWLSVTNKGNNYKFSDFTLPTNFSFTIKYNRGGSGTMRVGCGDTTHTNSSGYLEWIFAWYQTSLYYRDNTNAEKSTSVSFNEASGEYTIEYNGTTLKIYQGDTVIKTQTTYDPLGLTRLIRLNSDTTSYIDWIKVKAL